MKLRITAGHILVLVFYGIMIVILFLFQITPHGEPFRELGRMQTILPFTIQGERGTIFDRNGNPLALNVPYLKIYKSTARLSPSVVNTLLRQRDDQSELNLYAIKNGKIHTKIASFKFRSETIKDLERSNEVVQKIVGDRYYPYGEVTAPVIGCIGEDENPLGGLELIMDPIVRGKPGKILYLRDARGNLIKLNEDMDEDPKPGNPVTTTICLSLQEFCYYALKERVEEVGASRGFVIVTDPETGEILALTSYPSSNPNKKIPAKNIAVEDPYEPGSTFKLVTYTCALENKIVELDDTINTENGKYNLAGHLVVDEHAESLLTVRDAFTFSSNIAAAKIGLKLGPEKLFRTAQKFGIGCPSGINLGGESAPAMKKPSTWGTLRTANIAYGYGVMVNGIQMAMAYGAVANGGFLLTPRILKNGKRIVVRRAVSEEVADTLKEMLYDVVERGTGKKAKVPGIEICGKTGTAKAIDLSMGKYSSDAIISSFIGFFPKDNPKYLVYTVIFGPKGPAHARYGGEVAAPLFKRIAEFIMRGNDAIVKVGTRT
ncbi:MAG: penicillin-binding protein 2 [Candidatus Hydrothermia bacterium]|nr:penicillin-binding protein 2 [Candidatus Hydrothermae bacterium]HOK22847.1 penicillin-binding protein 2 [Candidatus Hydrothermia bacterium]HOL23556.1 penicillin-binding protein 2 [Candidatus Hydrothermia bacterium]HPO78562.1 penicillin-binding protein 2 [Candidatus Hydrothermia bacterium]